MLACGSYPKTSARRKGSRFESALYPSLRESSSSLQNEACRWGRVGLALLITKNQLYAEVIVEGERRKPRSPPAHFIVPYNVFK